MRHYIKATAAARTRDESLRDTVLAAISRAASEAASEVVTTSEARSAWHVGGSRATSSVAASVATASEAGCAGNVGSADDVALKSLTWPEVVEEEALAAVLEEVVGAVVEAGPHNPPVSAST